MFAISKYNDNLEAKLLALLPPLMVLLLPGKRSKHGWNTRVVRISIEDNRAPGAS